MGNGIRDKKLRRVLRSSKVNCEALFLCMELVGGDFVRGNVNCGGSFQKYFLWQEDKKYLYPKPIEEEPVSKTFVLNTCEEELFVLV